MDIISDFLGKNSSPRHPRIKVWSYHISKSATSRIDFYRKREGLVKADPEILLECLSQDGELIYTDMCAWDDDLNEYLVDKGIKCSEPENESERFGFILTQKMAPIELKYGDGYFNIVVYDYFNEKLAAKADKTREMLKAIYRGNSMVSERKECVDMIHETIKHIATCIKEKLKYSNEDASIIFDWAIALYLDDRFHVSTRRILGLS